MVRDRSRQYHAFVVASSVFFEDKNADGCIKTEGEAKSEEDLEIVQRLLYYPFGMALEGLGAWSAQPRPGGQAWQQYRYNGKEKDTLTGWYEYGFRWYIDGIGRFTGVDPIADQFAWVSVFNYAENEPVGHIDLWGLQISKPKFIHPEVPGDIPKHFLHNLKEGAKAAASTFFGIIGDGLKILGAKIEGALPKEGSATSNVPGSSGHFFKGTGVEILSSIPLKNNGGITLSEAEGGADAIIETKDILFPAGAGGALGDAASATRASMLFFHLGASLEKSAEAVENVREDTSAPRLRDSINYRWVRLPNSSEYRIDTTRFQVPYHEE